MTTTMAVVLLALGTWLMRAVGVVYGGSELIPRRAHAALQHVAPAVLASFVALGVTDIVRRDAVPVSVVAIGGLLLVALVVGRTGRSLLAIAGALVLALLIDLA